MTEKKYIKFCMAQVKSSRVAISAIGWYRKGVLLKLRLHDRNLKGKSYFKIMYKDFKKWVKGKLHITIIFLRSRKIRQLSKLVQEAH